MKLKSRHSEPDYVCPSWTKKEENMVPAVALKPLGTLATAARTSRVLETDLFSFVHAR